MKVMITVQIHPPAETQWVKYFHMHELIAALVNPKEKEPAGLTSFIRPVIQDHRC